MNKRIKKKKVKQLREWIDNNFDVLDANGNYNTIGVRCHKCAYFESGDSSVGLTDGCVSSVLYDKNDEIIPKVDKRITEHMMNLGYGCPCFHRKWR